MSDRIIIEGIDAYNGEHDLGEEAFNHRELHIIKRISGLRVFEIDEAFKAGDSDLGIALAVIALTRNGKHVDEEMLWAAEGGSIRFVPGEADARPPDPQVSEPAVNGNSSGKTSGPSSENQEKDPSPTGEPVSSADYAHPI